MGLSLLVSSMGSFSSLSVPGVCISVLGGMVFVLGFNVSLQRMKAKVAGPVPTDPKSRLYIASRAHGNAIEYIPTAIGMIIWLSLNRPYPSWVDYAMIGFTAARVMFSAGLLCYPNMERPNPVRKYGAIGTYLCGTALAVAVGLYGTRYFVDVRQPVLTY